MPRWPSRYSVTPSIEATLTGGSAIAVSPTQENPTEAEQLTHGESLREVIVNFVIIVRVNAARQRAALARLIWFAKLSLSRRRPCRTG